MIADRIFFALTYARDQSCPDFDTDPPIGGHASDEELMEIASHLDASEDDDAIETMREGSSNCIGGDDYVRYVDAWRAA